MNWLKTYIFIECSTQKFGFICNKFYLLNFCNIVIFLNLKKKMFFGASGFDVLRRIHIIVID